MLGNSLLNAGIRFDEAHALLLPEIDARRLMVFDTTYYDWYYGIRRLYAEGVRPDVVILVLTPRQLTISKIRGNYFAYHLMRMADVFVGGERFETLEYGDKQSGIREYERVFRPRCPKLANG